MTEAIGSEYMGHLRRLYQTGGSAEIQSALQTISPDLPREEWVKVGMAIKSELGEAGFSLFDEWSTLGQSYRESDCRSTWRSIDAEGGISIGTLFAMAKEGGWTSGNGYKGFAPLQNAPKPIQKPQDPQAGLDKAAAYWSKGKPITESAYAARKGIQLPPKVRGLGDLLLVPMYNADKALSSVQSIEGSGKKRFLKDTQIKGCNFPIGKPIDDTIVICEGFATGASIHEATGHAVAVAFSSQNLGHVARIMRQRSEDRVIVIAPDNDTNQAAVMSAEAAAGEYGCQVVVPQFPEGVEGTDFNDLHQVVGAEEVARQLEGNRYSPQEETSVELDQTDRIFQIPNYPLEALGPVLGPAAKALASKVQVPAHLAGQSVLAAAALAVQGHYNVQIDDRPHPLSLFCLTIGQSGERKSGCDKLALKPHKEWERERQKEANHEYEAYRNELDTWKYDRTKAVNKDGNGLDGFRPEPKPPIQGAFLCEEPTLEGLQKSFRFGPASQGLFSDEGGQFFGGHAMNPDNALKTLAGLSKFWDGAPIKRTRSANGESWAGYERRLSMHLMVQPIVAHKVLSDRLMREQGILARFLITSGQHLYGQRPYEKTKREDDIAIEQYCGVMNRLLKKDWQLDEDGGLTLSTLRPVPAAMELWTRTYNAIESQLGDGGAFAEIRPAASKMPENIARIAGVLAAVEGSAEISLTVMDNAVTLGSYYLDQYSLNTRSGKKYQQDTRLRALMRWLQDYSAKNKTNSLDVNTISKNAPTGTGVRKSVDRVRESMLQLNQVNAVSVEELDKHGRPKKWRVRQ